MSVATLSNVDGEVTVALGDRFNSGDNRQLVQVFDGQIATPTKRIAVVTSEEERVVEAVVSTEATRVTISVDDARAPRIVQVVV